MQSFCIQEAQVRFVLRNPKSSFHKSAAIVTYNTVFSFSYIDWLSVLCIWCAGLIVVILISPKNISNITEISINFLDNFETSLDYTIWFMHLGCRVPRFFNICEYPAANMAFNMCVCIDEGEEFDTEAHRFAEAGREFVVTINPLSDVCRGP